MRLPRPRPRRSSSFAFPLLDCGSDPAAERSISALDAGSTRIESVKVRPLLPADTQAVADLFAETVRVVNAADYTAEQLSAWKSELPDLSSWRERLAGEAGIFVAEAAKRIVGFAAVTRDNHLDLLYTHARF